MVPRWLVHFTSDLIMDVQAAILSASPKDFSVCEYFSLHPLVSFLSYKLGKLCNLKGNNNNAYK